MDTKKRRPCLRIPASGFTNAKLAVLSSSHLRVTVVFIALTVLFHVLRFKKKEVLVVRKGNKGNREKTVNFIFFRIFTEIFIKILKL